MKNGKAIFNLLQQTQPKPEEEKEQPIKVFRFPSIAKPTSQEK